MSDKLREAFERDVCKPRRLRTMKVIATGEYVDLSTSAALEAFQAGYAHAMRGEKLYALDDGEVIHGFYTDPKDAEDAAHADYIEPFRIVTYVRQEEE